MDIKDFRVGQPVYVECVGDRSHEPVEIIPAIVTAVGKKYITVAEITNGLWDRFSNDKFGLGYHDRFREVTKYSSRKAIYLSRQEIADVTEKKRLCYMLRDVRFETFSLDQLTRINAILSE